MWFDNVEDYCRRDGCSGVGSPGYGENQGFPTGFKLYDPRTQAIDFVICGLCCIAPHLSHAGSNA